VPLRPSEAPSAALDIVREATRSIVAGRRAGTANLRAADPEGLTFETATQVFVLGASDLTSGAGLGSARPVAWRYVVRDGGRLLATADAAARGRSHSFSHVNEGPFAQATVEALGTAERLPELREGLFERRLLEVPALFSISLWLHDPDAAQRDVVVPLAPAPPGLEPGRPLAVGAFVDVLASLAARIGPDEGPRGKLGS
jgi:hypothetical protein